LWPFETLLLPLGPISHLHQLSFAQETALAEILSRLTRRYDNLFGVPFPYSMGWHGAPFAMPPDGVGGHPGPSASEESFTLHAHFYPPLLRSAVVRKFMVGFEMLGEGQRDITPEEAAAALRAAAEVPLFSSANPGESQTFSQHSVPAPWRAQWSDPFDSPSQEFQP
jgi:UDPglucose--hexose-1-phosphate uridylyltransferase